MELKKTASRVMTKTRTFAAGTVLLASLMGCGAADETGRGANYGAGGSRPAIAAETAALGCNAACRHNMRLERQPASERAARAKEPDKCAEPLNPRPGDRIPECARRTDYFGIPEALFNSAARRRLEEVRRRYDYMRIEPNVEDGRIRGVFVTTSIYGSGDTEMWGWFEYISTGAKPMPRNQGSSDHRVVQ
jgi:hypothetical protein